MKNSANPACPGFRSSAPERWRRLGALWVLGALLALSGCSGLRIVESDVQSFSSVQALPNPATYRFERLPSQQDPASQARQGRLEEFTGQALAPLGLSRDDAQPRWSVQVSARTQRFDRGPGDDSFAPAWGLGNPRRAVVTASGQVIWVPVFPPSGPPLPWYQRELSVIIRDLASGQIVYETHARSDGRWSDSDAVLPAMLTAALQGFPRPPTGPRRVNIEIPR